jgi:hypothetical protein
MTHRHNGYPISCTETSSWVQPLMGIEASQADFRRIWHCLPDLRAHVDHWCGDGNLVFIEFRLHASIGSTVIEWPIVNRLQLQDGKAIKRVTYFDPLAIVPRLLRHPTIWWRWWRLRATLHQIPESHPSQYRRAPSSRSATQHPPDAHQHRLSVTLTSLRWPPSKASSSNTSPLAIRRFSMTHSPGSSTSSHLPHGNRTPVCCGSISGEERSAGADAVGVAVRVASSPSGRRFAELRCGCVHVGWEIPASTSATPSRGRSGGCGSAQSCR